MIRINYGHTWCLEWIYWFLVSLLLSRVTLLFSLLSMGSSTITTNIRMRIIYAISFAKHANPFPPPAKEDFDVVWALQSENFIAFQIRFCFENGNCNLFLQINNDTNNSVCFHEDHDLLLSFIRMLHAISMLGYHNTLKSLTSPWFDCCLLVCLSKYNSIEFLNCLWIQDINICFC